MNETRDQRDVWGEVGRQFGDLGRVLKAHLSPDAARSPGDPITPDPSPPATDGPPTADPAGDDPWAAATIEPAPGATGSGPGATGSGSGSAGSGGDWDSARESVRRLGESAQRFAAQTGDAARDPEVRDTANRAARTLGDAITTTVETVTEELRRRTRNPRWSDQTRPSEPPPVARIDDDAPR